MGDGESMAAEDVFGIVGTIQAGNFHIEKVVAEGGFGVVYRAHHGGFRAPVAIKCLKIPDQMTKQARDVFLEKFREEAELMFRLSAAIAEVCRPLHVDVLHLADGRFVPFLAMEWLEGESLDAIITRRREQGLPPLGLQKVMKMMRPVAVALARAHRCPGPQGVMAIIHRDLKPENLMVASVGGTESMKILDFGIAKAKRAASQAVGRLTGRGVAEDEMASFTPAYGAPEQWVPKTWGETGPWTDVWGLALTMVEALTGAPPIDGEPWVMRRICLDDKRRPTPRNHGADVPMEVEKVFEQALALDPRKRFKTIEAFWSELEKAMGLVPTIGQRDDRREPGEHSGEEGSRPPGRFRARDRGSAAPRPEAPRRAGRVELARINLQAAPVRGRVRSRRRLRWRWRCPLHAEGARASRRADVGSSISPRPRPAARPRAEGLAPDRRRPPSARPSRAVRRPRARRTAPLPQRAVPRARPPWPPRRRRAAGAAPEPPPATRDRSSTRADPSSRRGARARPPHPQRPASSQLVAAPGSR